MGLNGGSAAPAPATATAGLRRFRVPSLGLRRELLEGQALGGRKLDAGAP